jgi:hypothetical protein
MDLQTRKLNVIEYLYYIRDENVLSRIESTIGEAQKQQMLRRKAKPFTQEQLVERANSSMQDYRAGKCTTQEQLETESENW